MTKVCFVIPCYFEEEMLPYTIEKMQEKYHDLLQKALLTQESRILFVDDGSGDKTWEILSEASSRIPFVMAIRLSRNCGHQNALLAGMTEAYELGFDAVITMDADLQDDIRAIDEFLVKFQEGYQVVYGVRSSREHDSFFKRETALAFYRLMKSLGVPLVYNHADYRLLGRHALEALLSFPERNLFLRGLVPLVGFPSTEVYYVRQQRIAGKTKYPLRKMIGFALNAITSFSIQPIRWISAMGLFVSGISVVILFYSLVQKLRGHTVAGWTSVMFSLWFLGGMILLALGIIGEYIGRIYVETKQRPRFFIQERRGIPSGEKHETTHR